MSDYIRQKRCEAFITGEKVDEISNLPDCVLHHILSFLPTKDVVKTSILSSRWKNLWISVPNVDLDDELLYTSKVSGGSPLEVTSFMNFVERVLKVRNGASIKNFRLSCRVCFDASSIRGWLATAMMHSIRELDVCLFVGDPFALPSCVFDGKSLTVMKLEMNAVLELPSRIFLPCLKTLHLSLITFSNEESTQNLFSSCPALQELAIIDCEWINLKSLTITNSSLRNLTIDDLPYLGPYGPNYDDPRGCLIKIITENLVHLDYVGYLCNEIVLHNVSSLVEAFIDIPYPWEKQSETFYRGLLRELHNINSLKITQQTIQSLYSADNVMDHLPVFQNLSYLELNMAIDKRKVGVLLGLLHCCPKLQDLYFPEGPECHKHCDDGDLVLKSVPKCVISSLKSIIFKDFYGRHNEICFLRYLLSNGLVLERMTVYWCRHAFRTLKMHQEVESLQMLVKNSMACVLTFL